MHDQYQVLHHGNVEIFESKKLKYESYLGVRRDKIGTKGKQKRALITPVEVPEGPRRYMQ